MTGQEYVASVEIGQVVSDTPSVIDQYMAAWSEAVRCTAHTPLRDCMPASTYYHEDGYSAIDQLIDLVNSALVEYGREDVVFSYHPDYPGCLGYWPANWE
jgi:hypothetical protein